MRSLIIVLSLFGTLSSMAQDTLTAVVEGDSIYFDYEDYASPDEPIGDLIFLKGCSWYCAGGVDSIYSSSQLSKNNKASYNPENTHDFKEATAWVEGASGYGIGESITYVFDYSERPEMADRMGINELIVANGYKKSRELWQLNSRVRTLRMYVNEQHYADIRLQDHFEIQTVKFEPVMFKEGRKEVRFEILDVYPGDKYQDTAISLLMFDGLGDH